jgi:cytochrome bd-type quinol oxidase subunit 2
MIQGVVSWLLALPTWVLAVGLLTVVLGYWWYRERSTRGVQRRAQKSSKKAVAGIGVGIGGVLYAALGVMEGLSGVTSQFGDVLLELAGPAAYWATTAAGYFSLKGDLALSAKWFAIAAAALFVLGVALDD